MESALEEDWDVVTADHYMPSFNATQALALLRRRGLDLPFIVVSGRIGEDVAVAAMRAGAHDYIMKDNLARLAPAIEREVREAAVRRERGEAQRLLLRSEERYRRVVEQAADALFVHDLEGRFVDVNRQACISPGYTREELLGMSVVDVEVGIIPGSLSEMWRGMDFETSLTIGGVNRRKDGTTFPVEVRLGPFEAEERWLVLAAVRDITGRKRAEEALAQAREAERSRIAQDLHDDALQDIVYALQEAQVMRELSEDGEAPALVEIVDALRRSVEGMRVAIFELRLEEILEEPFAVSLKPLLELHRRMSRSTQEVEVRVEDGFPEEIPAKAARKLLRIVQEALNNARRHSGARRVRVALSAEGGRAWRLPTTDGASTRSPPMAGWGGSPCGGEPWNSGES